ncbi:ArsC family reductase [Erythrobacter sp. 3-20A1M]|uniref:ArsC family reductase n=1 Tax=Erythrobacter sp. 3-20A1M TaxID=2653850 RepID=UPI001BFC5AD9|nr:ArsC family reductase [Erythrobacter sp. 3-20A1M]QWC57234.1 ArsC family reductase [Erythrobacter sp. 3-20A1M]
MITLYGIPNCDTVRKARKWLDAKGLAYNFHDFRKDGADRYKIHAWVDEKGLGTVLNTRGTTYRQLSPAQKAEIDGGGAAAVMAANPAMIKRPVVEHSGGLLVGFSENRWEAALC